MRITATILMTLALLAFAVAPAVAEEKADLGTEQGSLKALEDGMFSIKKGSFNAAAHMRLQAWGGWVGDEALLSNGDKMQEPGFRLRRTRFGISGAFLKGVDFKLELDLFDKTSTGGPLYEASVDFKPMAAYIPGLSVGVQKFLFMKDEMLSSGYMPHLDRSVGTLAMAPGNSLGAVLYFEPWKDRLFVYMGAYNGLTRTDSFHTGYISGVGQSAGNRYEGLAYAGRIDLTPFGKMGKGIADPDQTDKLLLGLGGAAFYNDGSSIGTLGYSGYLHLKGYGLHLFAEFAQDKSEPQAEPTTTNTISSTIEARVITASLGYVFLKNTLGLAVRGELIDDNLDMDTEGDQWLLTGTLTYYALGDYLKFMLEYTHRAERYGLTIDNDYGLGGLQLMF